MIVEDVTEVDAHIARVLRQRRRHLNLTQAEVAAHAGVRFQQIGKYEATENAIRPSTLFRIAQALDLPIEAFFPAYQPQKETP